MRTDAPRPQLSPRRREVLELVMQGYTSARIAERLVVSPKTAEAHVEAVRELFGYRTARAMVCGLWSERVAALEARNAELERLIGLATLAGAHLGDPDGGNDAHAA